MNATTRTAGPANRFFEAAEVPPRATPGWRVRRVSAPSSLYGANGITIGPDARLYVAQFLANRVSAIDPELGTHETIVPLGSEVNAPDDTAFDSRGTMYITDTMPGRVWARDPDGRLRVIADDLPCANGITCHDDRVFVNENREGGRLFEVFADGSTPRLMLDGLAHPNAMAVGPDGLLYVPLIIGEIWRVGIDAASPPEKFIDGLLVPPAAKFDASGRLVTLSSITGEVISIDLPSRSKTVVTRLAPGLDNVACGPDGRMYTSHFTSGQIIEIGRDGTATILSPPGLIGPAGIAVDGNGSIAVADLLGLVEVGPDGALSTMGTLLDPGFPGVVRGLALGPDGAFYATTTGGSVVRYHSQNSSTIAESHNELMGIDVAADGTVFVAEAGSGRVLRIRPGGEPETVVAGLGRPIGVGVAADGGCFATDAQAGHVLRVHESGVTRFEGFASPQGVVGVGDTVFVTDAETKQLVALSPTTGKLEVVCDSLPIGDPVGHRHRPPLGDALVPGPLTGMTGLAVDRRGALYVSANGEGSVIKIERLDATSSM